ncbi:hypothetical protein [Ensifer soli]|uniref:hypothetical protein n=1 Tax=Ciceribacter sp. sgz301302 TaxID=3342379 RepID=UPI0035BA1BE4
MTMVNILRLDNVVTMLTDTKITADGAGNLGNWTKFAPIPHLSAVIATRGPMKALDLVCRMTVSEARDFAHLRRTFEDFGRLFFNQLRTKEPVGDVDIFVIGWDDGSQAFTLSTHDKHGAKPFEVVDIPHVLVTPATKGGFVDALQGDGAIAAMMRLVAEQARIEPAVGGRVTAVTVREGGVIVIEPFGQLSDEPLDLAMTG